VDSIFSVPGRDGVIKIQTRPVSQEIIEVTISDNGRGIDEKSLEEIFKPFYTTKSQGTGLGLAICRRLIEQHEGTITVENNREGDGVTFILAFPVMKAQPQIEMSDETDSA